MASGVEGLHRLVPALDERSATPTPAGFECGTDAHHRLRDKREVEGGKFGPVPDDED